MEDREGLITFVEGKGLDALGGESSEFVGRPVSSLFPDIPSVRQEGRHLRPGETYNSNITVKNRTFDLCYSPIQDSRGEISGFIGVALDVTERMRAQAELERNRQEGDDILSDPAYRVGLSAPNSLLSPDPPDE